MVEKEQDMGCIGNKPGLIWDWCPKFGTLFQLIAIRADKRLFISAVDVEL